MTGGGGKDPTIGSEGGLGGDGGLLGGGGERHHAGGLLGGSGGGGLCGTLSGGDLGGYCGDGGGGGLEGGGGLRGGGNGECEGGGGDGDGGGMLIAEPSSRMSIPTTSGLGCGSNKPIEALLATTTTEMAALPSKNARRGEQSGRASDWRKASHSAW